MQKLVVNLNDFKFTTNFSYDATNNNRVSWQNNQYGNAANVNGRGSVISSINSTLNFNQLLNYTKTINSDHKIGVLLGHENYNYNSGYLGGGKENFLLLNNSQLDNAVVIQSLSSYTDRYAVEGYFGNINYSYKSKYTASGSIRRDASSRFAPEHRWGTFWSTSAGYVLSEESFIKDLTFIDLLKLRASYGTRGNDDLGNSRNYYYAYQDQYSVTNNNGNTAIALVYKGNRDITWETRKDFNIGLDFGLFKSRLNGTIEYYHSKTQDLLFDLPLPLSTGITSQPYNIGDLKNTGIELGLNGDVIKTEDFKWNISLNASRPKNTITKLPEQFRQNGLKTGNFNYMEGHSIYDYFTYKYAGVDPNSGEALYFKDVTDANGIVTGKTTVKKTADATRYYTGDSAIPKFFGGIGTSITYRDFDFSIQTSYRIGGKVMDYSYRALMSGGGGDWVNWHKDILKSWTPENKNSNIPIIKENYTYGNETSDRFLIDASYFSIQNITLGYKLPAAFVKKYKLGTIRIYAVADNVYLWAKRKGLDPRQAFNGTIESGSYSPMRTVSMGLNINF